MVDGPGITCSTRAPAPARRRGVTASLQKMPAVPRGRLGGLRGNRPWPDPESCDQCDEKDATTSAGPRTPAGARRRFRGDPRCRVRRPARRRVHLRADRPGLARGAGPDPRLRLDRDRAGRRRQRREERRGARRRAVGDWRGGAGRDLASACSRRSAARRHARHAAARLSHADQDAHPRRRVHSAKQQVVRIDRATRPELSAPIAATVKLVRRRRGATPCSSPTTAPGWSQRRSSGARPRGLPDRDARRRCSSTRGMRCSGSAG